MKKLLFFLLALLIILSCKSESDNPEVKVSQKVELPKYKIHEVVKKIDGNIFADILIPNISTKISIDSLSKITFAIVKKEGLSEASFYRTTEAIKAMYSDSYSKKHPQAIAGYIGSIENRKFIPN